MTFGRWKMASGLLMVAALAACSGTEGPQQGPGPMLADNACAQLRSDLNAMDRRGVPGYVDSRNSGKKLSAQQDAEASRYNQVLDQYLGGQCASEARYKAKAGIPQSAPSSGRRASSDSESGVSTASLSKPQVKRRKPVSEDGEQAASSNDQNQDKPVRRKSAAKGTSKANGESSTAERATPASVSTGSIPTPTPAKAESGLPSAPAPVKAEPASTPAPAAAKEESSEKKE
jgi:hypothetical protein